jgi:hypothetical protein
VRTILGPVIDNQWDFDTRVEKLDE